MSVQQEPQATKTITLDDLHRFAHTLGASVEYTRQVLSSEFDVQIDDTPDTGEQSMTTITRDRLQQIARENTAPGEIVPDIHWLEAVVSSIGITIVPSAYTEAMVKLASEIVAAFAQDAASGVREGGWDNSVEVRIALAALQHAAKVVKGAPYVSQPSGRMADRAHILTALGAA